MNKVSWFGFVVLMLSTGVLGGVIAAVIIFAGFDEAASRAFRETVAAKSAPVAPTKQTRTWWVGATMDEVLSIEGTPTEQFYSDGEMTGWRYGNYPQSAFVVFRNGRVNTFDNHAGILHVKAPIGSTAGRHK